MLPSSDIAVKTKNKVMHRKDTVVAVRCTLLLAVWAFLDGRMLNKPKALAIIKIALRTMTCTECQ